MGFIPSLGTKIPQASLFGQKKPQTTTVPFRGFRGGSDGKESAYNARNPDSIPGLGRSPGEGNGNHSIFLAWRIPGEGSLAGCSPETLWGHKESDTT